MTQRALSDDRQSLKACPFGNHGRYAIYHTNNMLPTGSRTWPRKP